MPSFNRVFIPRMENNPSVRTGRRPLLRRLTRFINREINLVRQGFENFAQLCAYGNAVPLGPEGVLDPSMLRMEADEMAGGGGSAGRPAEPVVEKEQAYVDPGRLKRGQEAVSRYLQVQEQNKSTLKALVGLIKNHPYIPPAQALLTLASLPILIPLIMPVISNPVLMFGAAVLASLLPAGLITLRHKAVASARICRVQKQLNRLQNDVLERILDDLSETDRDRALQALPRARRRDLLEPVMEVSDSEIIMSESGIKVTDSDIIEAEPISESSGLIDIEPMRPEPVPQQPEKPVPPPLPEPAQQEPGAGQRIVNWLKNLGKHYRSLAVFIELLPEGELKDQINGCFRDRVVYLGDILDILERKGLRQRLSNDAKLLRAYDAAHAEVMKRLKVPEWRQGDGAWEPSPGNDASKGPEPQEPAQPVPPPLPGQQKVQPEALALRDQVRALGQRLLFTRNIDLREFTDIADKGRMGFKDRWGGTKYFRYGLSHEYGNLTIVMKPGFWAQEKDVSRLGNLFLEKVSGKTLMEHGVELIGCVSRSEIVALFSADPAWQQFFIDPNADYLSFKRNAGKLISKAPITEQQREGLNRIMMGMLWQEFRTFVPDLDQEGLLNDLVSNVEYNCLLERKEYEEPPDALGHTVLFDDNEKFMGHYPQLEVAHELDLEMVERILVPEHLWAAVSERAKNNPTVRALLQKVEGTGQTEAVFLAGREQMARRSRLQGGNLEPKFGDESFHLFEQAYFKLMLEVRGDGRIQSFNQLLSLTSDADFRSWLERVHITYLIPSNNPLRQLIGLEQYPSHHGLDPLEHTVNTMRLLRTDGLAEAGIIMPPGFRRPLAELLRIAMLYHDLGKYPEPRDQNHAQYSANMAAGVLRDPAISGVGRLTAQERAFILTMIRTHHLFGDFLKYDIDLPTAVQQVRSELDGSFPITTMFYLHLLIAAADIGSIPGVRARVDRVTWETYERGIYQALAAAS